MLANRYFQSGRFEEAILQLESALEKHPERHSARRKLVCCYLMIGRVADAVTGMTRLLDAAPRALRGVDPVDEGFPCTTSEEAMAKLSAGLTEGERHAACALVRLLFWEPGAIAELDLASEATPPLAAAGELRRVLSAHPETHHV